jgi:hypothetical protein
MVVVWFVEILVGFIVEAISLLPDLPTFAPLATLMDRAYELGGYANGYGEWVPWGAIPTAVGIVFAAIGFAFVVRVARIVLKNVTLGKVSW